MYFSLLVGDTFAHVKNHPKYHPPFGVFSPFLSVLGSQVLPRSLMTSQYLLPSFLGKYSFPLCCCVQI